MTVNFGLSEDETSSNERKDIHAYQGQEIQLLRRQQILSTAVTYEPIASCSSSASSLFVSSVVSVNAEEDQEQLQGEGDIK